MKSNLQLLRGFSYRHVILSFTDHADMISFCRSSGNLPQLMIPQNLRYFSFIMTSLMPSVLFFTLLLFALELPLFIGFSLLAGELLAFRFVFFVLLLQRLLRLRADAGRFHLFSRVSLTAFGVVRLLLLLRFYQL